MTTPLTNEYIASALAAQQGENLAQRAITQVLMTGLLLQPGQLAQVKSFLGQEMKVREPELRHLPTEAVEAYRKRMAETEMLLKLFQAQLDAIAQQSTPQQPR